MFALLLGTFDYVGCLYELLSLCLIIVLCKLALNKIMVSDIERRGTNNPV